MLLCFSYSLFIFFVLVCLPSLGESSGFFQVDRSNINTLNIFLILTYLEPF